MGRFQSCRHGRGVLGAQHTELSQSLDRRDDRRARGRHQFGDALPVARAAETGVAAHRRLRRRTDNERVAEDVVAVAHKPPGTANFITESDYRWPFFILRFQR